MNCVFCQIASGEIGAEIIWQSAELLAFLDNRPVFPGHVLLIPRKHILTLADVPPEGLQPLFTAAQHIERAIETSLGAEGTFVAINNRVSQSVPHLHVHLVPRRKGDGLKGFFWPRKKYDSEEHMAQVALTLRSALSSQ